MTTHNAEMSDVKRELYWQPDGDQMTDAQAIAETRVEIARLKAGGAVAEHWLTREEIIAALEASCDRIQARDDDRANGFS